MKRAPIAIVLAMTVGLATACSYQGTTSTGSKAGSQPGGQAGSGAPEVDPTGLSVPAVAEAPVDGEPTGDEDGEVDPADRAGESDRQAVARAGEHLLPANEASGLVASRRHRGVFYWLRDGGSSRPDRPRNALYALRLGGDGSPRPVRQAVLFPYASVFQVPNGDWEDVAIDDDDNLWIGDVGANNCQTQQYLFKALEPDPGAGDPFVVTSKYPIRVPDPAAGCRTRNIETMLWLDGALYLFTKTDASPVYRAEPAERNHEMPLVRVGEFADSSVKNISAASVSDDRTRLMVAGHARFWVFEADPSLRGDAYLRAAMSRPPSYEGRFESPGGASVEGGSYVPDSRDLVFVAEDRRIFHLGAQEYGDAQSDGHKRLPD